MPSVMLSSGTIHYLDQGHGPPVVLLHASPGDARDFGAIIPALASPYRVIAVDWPGYGSSGLPPDPDAVDVLFFYQVLCEFLDALALPPALFIGNSLGGNAAARLAARRPASVRALVLVAPGGFTAHNAATRAFCALQASGLSLPPSWFARLYLRGRTPTTSDMRERAATEHAEPRRVAMGRALWRSFGRPDNDLRVEARAITAPTLLVFGARDPVISARRDGAIASQSMPAASRVTLPCGHAPFAELPERFLEEVLPFLGRWDGG